MIRSGQIFSKVGLIKNWKNLVLIVFKDIPNIDRIFLYEVMDLKPTDPACKSQRSSRVNKAAND